MTKANARYDNRTDYDTSGKQLSYAIEVMGPIILAIKSKFDARSNSESVLPNKDAFIGTSSMIYFQCEECNGFVRALYGSKTHG